MSSTEWPVPTNSAVSSGELRKFGLLVGGVFLAIALWPVLVRGSGPRTWALILGALLVVPAIGYPLVLRPVHRVWMGLAQVLGWINTRLILGIAFFLVFTPTALILRLLKRSPMALRVDPSADTYRVARKARLGTHMKNQF